MKAAILFFIWFVMGSFRQVEERVFILEDALKILLKNSGEILLTFIRKDTFSIEENSISVHFKKGKIYRLDCYEQNLHKGTKIAGGNLYKINRPSSHTKPRIYYSSSNFLETKHVYPAEQYDIIAKGFLKLPNAEKLRVLKELCGKYNKK